MDLNKSNSDDEDLEALRLAALQSLKKKNEMAKTEQQPQFRPLHSTGKRGRFYQTNNNAGRGGKNGQFTRIRNSNLIPIQVQDKDRKDEKMIEMSSNENVRLTLPQDRYCSKNQSSDKEEKEESSKFSRFDDKSESESEEDEDLLSSDDEEEKDNSPGNLQRSDSLEALMQELDDEIQGKSTKSVEKKVKSKKSGRKISNIEKPVEKTEEVLPVEENVVKEEKVEKEEVVVHNENEKLIDDKTTKKEVPVNLNKSKILRNFNKKVPSGGNKIRNRPFGPPNRPRGPPIAPMNQFNGPFPQNMPPFPIPYNTPVYPAPIIQPNFTTFPTNPYVAAPPLKINVDPIELETNLQTAMAPLSPRSAAFVLENRAIIEKRKRSPQRRSYSRSPSPRRSRSRTPPPRRSPNNYRRSRSPLPPRKPQRLSPKRSTRKENSTGGTSSPAKPNIRQRLGLKDEKKDEKTVEAATKEMDPVLEARKRKFESNEIKIKEGVIRLKPKLDEANENSNRDNKEDEEDDIPKSNENKENNENTVVAEEEEEEEFDDDILESPQIDIFDDDESDEENEGRFKAKEATTNTEIITTVPSFSKLVNGEKPPIKEEALPDDRRDHRRDRTRRVKRARSRSRSRSKSPKRRITVPERCRERRERKIEIKIKNPTKYEPEVKSVVEKPVRKVAVASRKVIAPKDSDSDTEIIVENDSEDEDVKVKSRAAVEDSKQGDLRAQLSRKRAERLNKFLPVDGDAPPKRLLQNALQGAVFKKIKKHKSENEHVPYFEAVKRIVRRCLNENLNVCCFYSRTDGKLPIHLRLGITATADNDDKKETKVRKKSRKHKKQRADKQEQQQEV